MWTRNLLSLALLVALLIPAGCTVPEPTDEPGGGTGRTAGQEDRDDEDRAGENELDAAGGGAGAASPERSAPTVVAEGPGTLDEPLVLGLAARDDPAAEDALAELARLLAQETGLEVEADIAASPAELVETMAEGAIHAAWLEAPDYLLAHRDHAVAPLLVVERDGTVGSAGQILVRSDGDVDTLDGLVGTRFCRPDAGSLAGWLLPMLTLRAFGVEEADFGELIDVGDDEEVVRAVYEGRCDAGASRADARAALEEELPDVRETVAVLAATGRIPAATLCIIADVSPDLADMIVNGLLAASMSDDGSAALADALQAESLQPIDDASYDDLRNTLEKADMSLEEFAEAD